MGIIDVLNTIEELAIGCDQFDNYEMLIENIKSKFDSIANTDTTDLYLYNEGEEKLKLIYAKGLSKEEIEHAEDSAMEMHPGHVFKTGDILWVQDQDGELDSHLGIEKGLFNKRSHLYVPVKSGNKIAGAFGIQSEQANAFTDFHLKLLKIFAALAGRCHYSINQKILIKKLERKEKEFSRLLYNTNDLIAAYDARGFINYVNESWLNRMHYTFEDVVGTNIFSYIHQESHAHCIQFFNSLGTQQTHSHLVEYSLTTKHGKKIELNGTVICNYEDEKLIGINSFLKDVTDRNNSSRKIKEDSEIILGICEGIPESVVITDLNGLIVKWDTKSKSLFGWDETEVKGLDFLETIFDENTVPQFRNIIDECERQGSYEFELQHRDLKAQHKNGNEFYISMNLVSTKMNNEDLIMFFVMDSTERKKAKDELLLSKLMLDLILQSLSESVWAISIPDNEIEYIDKSSEDLYGYTVTEWYGNRNIWMDSIHPDDKTMVINETEKLYKLGQIYLEYRIITASKEEKWIYSRIKILKDDRNLPFLMVGISGDITERKIAEENIKKAKIQNVKLKSLYENILNNIPIDIALFDSDHKYLFINKEAIKDEQIRRWMIGKDDFDYARLKGNSEEIAVKRRKEFQSVIKSNKVAFWLDVHKNKSGEAIYKERRLHSFDNNNYVIGYAVDVTAQKAVEHDKERVISELIQRNIDLEQFSYIISHNLRLPVANIIGITRILADYKIDDNDKEQFLSGLVDSAKQLDGVIMDLNEILKVRRETSEKKEIVYFPDVLRRVTEDLKEIIKQEDVLIVSNFESIMAIDAIPAFMYSVFHNLITNSIKYKKENMTSLIEIKSGLFDGKVQLSFKDNGIGIDLKKNMNSVFGMYKRFHAKFYGKVMGLYMVKRQVESMGGTIKIESEVNKGSEFLLEFRLNDLKIPNN